VSNELRLTRGTMTKITTAPAPVGLSVRGRKLWAAMQAANVFTPDSAELFERGLRAFDLHDKLHKLAQKEGFGSQKSKGLLASARDAAMVGLKMFKGCGLDKVDTAVRRPGRPADAGWSAQRRGSA
jgi:hypothetical protein